MSTTASSAVCEKCRPPPADEKDADDADTTDKQDRGAEANSLSSEEDEAEDEGKPEYQACPTHPIFSYATFCANNNHLDCMRALVAEGLAELNVCDGDGDTPLCLAARMGNVDMVKLLLELGAEVNMADSHGGNTPLGFAVHRSLDDVAEVLRAAGAKRTEKEIEQAAKLAARRAAMQAQQSNAE
eukprot:INCI18527.1.p1 GENE.INCI18527.1~~INCI18527.1.p1  ORF type:complete len:185 (+),score=38.48 INCI18527.1:119-673(+)